MGYCMYSRSGGIVKRTKMSSSSSSSTVMAVGVYAGEVSRVAGRSSGSNLVAPGVEID